MSYYPNTNKDFLRNDEKLRYIKQKRKEIEKKYFKFSLFNHLFNRRIDVDGLNKNVDEIIKTIPNYCLELEENKKYKEKIEEIYNDLRVYIKKYSKNINYGLITLYCFDFLMDTIECFFKDNIKKEKEILSPFKNK